MKRVLTGLSEILERPCQIFRSLDSTTKGKNSAAKEDLPNSLLLGPELICAIGLASGQSLKKRCKDGARVPDFMEGLFNADLSVVSTLDSLVALLPANVQDSMLWQWQS